MTKLYEHSHSLYIVILITSLQHFSENRFEVVVCEEVVRPIFPVPRAPCMGGGSEIRFIILVTWLDLEGIRTVLDVLGKVLPRLIRLWVKSF